MSQIFIGTVMKMKLVDKTKLLSELVELKDMASRGTNTAVPQFIDWFVRIINGADVIEYEQPKSGAWIEHDDGCECPFCHKAWKYTDNDTDTFNHCPYCGAKLEGSE